MENIYAVLLIVLLGVIIHKVMHYIVLSEYVLAFVENQLRSTKKKINMEYLVIVVVLITSLLDDAVAL